jgi:hypothetical protein
MRHRLRQPAWPAASHDRQSILWTFPEKRRLLRYADSFCADEKFAPRIDSPKVWEL